MSGPKPMLAEQNAIPELQIDLVSKSYGDVKALDEVSFSIAAGKFVALLGPNGAGKTTLFQLLTGLFVADSGNIRLFDLDIRNDTIRALARIGVVFQAPTLDLDLTVRANLEFHGRLHGMSRSQMKARINDELERLGIADSAAVVCRNLSGGNRRKVELARSLLHEPRILFMDEATVGLDPASRQMLVAYVRELTRTRGISVLWTTHLVEEVQDADQILILHKGRIREQGSVRDLVANSGAATLTDAFLTITGAVDA